MFFNVPFIGTSTYLLPIKFELFVWLCNICGVLCVLTIFVHVTINYFMLSSHGTLAFYVQNIATLNWQLSNEYVIQSLDSLNLIAFHWY